MVRAAMLICVVSGLAFAQHDPQMHQQHMAELNKHGAEAMGFDQDKTTHHFRLYKDGGAVEVEAKSAEDSESIHRIREHLKEQAKKFAAGDFGAPQHTHSQIPPGAETMKASRARIKYEFEQSERGGRLRIATGDAKALAAVHQFLRFQIEDHETGDKATVE